MGVINSVVAAAASGLAKAAASWLTTPDDLHILTISLDVDEDEPRVAFNLEINQHLRAAEPKSITAWRFPCSSLGIPNRLAPEQQGVEVRPLPGDLVDGLKLALPDAKDIPLWIKLGSLAGYLRLVSWDSLLHEALERPILRLIDLESPPAREVESSLSVVLCASEPRAKVAFSEARVINTMARRILDAGTRQKVAIHVFTDEARHGELENLLADVAGQVRLHAVPAGGPESITHPDHVHPPEITNIWLRWICHTLEEPVDVVHFVGHGYLASEQGWLAVAESPTRNIDREWSRFIGGAELDAFLVHVGAWSVAFSAPPGNYSPAGLRLLTNQVAEDGLRPALLHDLGVDPDCSELKDAYHFLYHPGRDFAPGGAALSLYCHPDMVKVSTKANRAVRAVSGLLPGQFGFTISDETVEKVAGELNQVARQLEASGGVPAWLAITERYVEQRRLELRRLERDGGDQSGEQREQIQKAKAMLLAIEQTAVTLAKAKANPAGVSQ